MQGRLRIRWLACLVAGSLVAAACSGGGADVASQQPTQTPSATPTAAASPTPTSDATPEPIPPFPEPDPSGEPLPVDPAVRIGTLDNGLTYYVRSNDVPGGRLQLRLVVNAGSMQQEDATSGIAHFLEHMLFNGTARFPGNELDKALARLGSEFGPDVNAYTSYEETVYLLEVDAADDEAVGLGFDVLEQWASAATLAATEVVAERGVVREELRLSEESPEATFIEEFEDAYTGGTPYQGRHPLGVEERILAMGEAELRSFYDRWYRPDLMAVVAVGDLPVDRLEDEIVDRFSGLSARGDTPDRVDPQVSRIGDTDVRLVVAPDTASTFGSIDFSLPAWDATTSGGERLSVIEDLIALMTQARLAESAQVGTSELLEPIGTTFSKARQQRFLGYNFDAPDLGAATQFVLDDLTRLRVTGFGEDELRRAVEQVLAGLDNYLASSARRVDSALAAQYANHFLAGVDLSTPEQVHERLTALLEGLTVEEVNDHYRWVMDGSAPIVIVVGPDPAELPTLAELEAAVESGTRRGSLAVEGDTSVEEIAELMQPPLARAEIEARAIPDLVGMVSLPTSPEPAPGQLLVFENGVSVAYLYSDLWAGHVEVGARGNGGWSTLAPGEGPLVQLAADAVARSGVGDVDRRALDRFLRDSTVSVNPYVAQTSEGFTASATTDELETLFQLLHLRIVEPRVDDSALREVVATAGEWLRAAETDPDRALSLEMYDARYGADPHQVSLATEEQLDELTAESALELYESRLGDVDDLVVTVVGDVPFDDVATMARRYLGTLPAGDPDTWTDVSPPPPDGVVVREIEVGTGVAPAGVAVRWSVLGEPSDEQRVALAVVDEMVAARVLASVRERLGASYSPRAAVRFSERPEPELIADITVEGDPDRVAEIRETILAEVGDLVDNGPTDDEVDRARAVVRSDLELTYNRDLSEWLQDHVNAPDEPLFTNGRQLELLGALSDEDILAALTLAFPTDQRIEVIRTPR